MSEDSSEMGKAPQCCWFVQTNRVLPSKPQIQGISLMSRYRNGNCGLSPESCWPAVGSISEGPCRAAHSPEKKCVFTKPCRQNLQDLFVSLLAVRALRLLHLSSLAPWTGCLAAAANAFINKARVSIL